MRELRQPMFRVSDRVVVIAPSGTHHGAMGSISKIYAFAGMHRYVVEFEVGKTAVFFGFELVLCT